MKQFYYSPERNMLVPRVIIPWRMIGREVAVVTIEFCAAIGLLLVVFG